MRISTFFYILRQGIANIFRNKSFSLASIATISACLFLLGLFYAILANFQATVMKAEEGVSVTVFFHCEADECETHEEGQIPTEERLAAVGDEIKAYEIEGQKVASRVEFISDDQAWENFASQFYGENYALGFPENPLEGEDSYEVYLNDVSKQSNLVEWLKGIKEVRKVNYSEITADTLTGANKLIAYISMAIIVILLAVSIFLIKNTVTIGISVRSEEINIMKYIGAKDFFVRAPFVIEGILIGIIGAAIPMGLIYVMYRRALEYVAQRFAILSGFMDFLPVEEIYKVLLPIALLLGAGIGFLGSLTSVKKHLKV